MTISNFKKWLFAIACACIIQCSSTFAMVDCTESIPMDLSCDDNDNIFMDTSCDGDQVVAIPQIPAPIIIPFKQSSGHHKNRNYHDHIKSPKSILYQRSLAAFILCNILDEPPKNIQSFNAQTHQLMECLQEDPEVYLFQKEIDDFTISIDNENILDFLPDFIPNDCPHLWAALSHFFIGKP